MQFGQLKRRQFITLLGAAAWPLAARAQQPDGMRRIAVLMDTDDSNSNGQARVAALGQTLQQLGWTEGRNVRVTSEPARCHRISVSGLRIFTASSTPGDRR
jgi:hypothetical protein